MINIKITKRNITEDYIAVERETGSILLPSKHVFGIFSIGVISILLALPFGQLVPIEASPFSAFTAGRVEQNKKFEQAYLTNNEQVSEQNIEIASTAGSEENYDDEIVPEALLASNDIDESLASEDKANSSTQVNLSAHIPSVKEKFKATAIEPTQKDITDTTTSVNEKQEISLAVAQMQARIMEQKNDAKWYEQTVRKGDSLYKIFNYLNLDNNELKKIMAVAKKDRAVAAEQRRSSFHHISLMTPKYAIILTPVGTKRSVIFLSSRFPASSTHESLITLVFKRIKRMHKARIVPGIGNGIRDAIRSPRRQRAIIRDNSSSVFIGVF